MWASKYIGMQYDHNTFNCADFCSHVLKIEKGIDLTFPRASQFIRDYSKQIIEEMNNFCEPKRTNNPEEFDLVLMYNKGIAAHVGLLVIDKLKGPKVLHNMKDFGSVVLHDFKFLNTVGLRIDGFYKWKTK